MVKEFRPVLCVNVLRIAQRYLNGGHEVPISKVFSRYYKSLALAAQAIGFVDRAYTIIHEIMSCRNYFIEQPMDT